MEEKKVERINELYKLSKERELTEEEKSEQQILRAEYINSYKASLVSQLDNTYIVEPDGSKHKVKKADESEESADD